MASPETTDNQEPKLNRFEKRKLKYRAKITDAALQLFEENGVAATNIAAIIKEADISNKTFFNHFPTKDHLLRHIVHDTTQYAYDYFSDALEKFDDPAEQLAYAFGSISEQLEPMSSAHKELIYYYLISGSTQCEIRDEQRDKFNQSIHKILQNAADKGQLRKGFDIDSLKDLAIGNYVVLLIRWSTTADYPIVEKTKAAVELLSTCLFSND